MVATAFALTFPENFLTNYSNFLTILLYFLIPWTAINLIDFYVVRRGHYAIMEIFNPHGLYRRWQWRGLTAYAVGFASMTPFFSTAIYTGPVASAAGGADFSIFVGLVVSGGLYYLLSRNVDFSDERRLADAEDAELRGAGSVSS